MVVEILVSGLCAFVRDTCAAGKTKGVSVVMLKGDMPHHPRLVVNAHDVLKPADNDSGEVVNGRQLAEVVDLPDGEEYFVWDLTGCRLEIVQAPSIEIWEGKRNPKSSKPDDRPHAGEDPPDDFSWAPNDQDSCSTTPRETPVDPDALNDDVLPSYADARLMKLKVAPNTPATSNWLETQILGELSKEPEYEYGNNSKPVLADRARLTLGMPSGTAVLRLVPYDKANPVREIHLTQLAVTGPGSDRVRVTISNLPNVREVPKASVDHFADYWKLLPTANMKNCSVPVDKAMKTDPGKHVYPVKCTICQACGFP